MWEMLIVLGIYLVFSFIGVAVLWTLAAKKGLVSAPKYFFWIERRRRALVKVNELNDSSTYWNGRSIGFGDPSSLLDLAAMASSSTARIDTAGSTDYSNQGSCVNALPY